MNHISSPDTSDAGIERLIQAKGKTASRVTPEIIESVIVTEAYFTALQGAVASAHLVQTHGNDPDIAATDKALSVLTFCVLILKNGFTVTGESACASPENFDADIGRKIARQNAVNKIWPLLGFELRSKLAAGGAES